MIYLVIAILFYVLFSVIFKVCQQRGIHNLVVILVNYIAAAAFAWVKIFIDISSSPQATLADYAYSAGCLPKAFVLACFFSLMFVVMDRSVWRSGMALSTAAAKVSLIVPVILSWLFLGQDAPLWGPTMLILISVVLIVSTTETIKHDQKYLSEKTDKQRSRRARLLLIAIFLGYGISDFMLKIVQSATGADKPTEALMATVFLMCIVISLVCCFVGHAFSKEMFRKEAIWWGLLLGVANVICTTCSVKALASMSTNLYYPLNNIGVVIVAALLGALVFKEKIKKTQLLGMLLALLAIIWLFVRV